MAHPDYIRDKARQMRVERNFTIDQIAERLALSRTTIYHWVKDLPIERSADRQSEGQRKRSARNVERCRQKRQAAYEQGAAEFAALAKDPTFRDFVCMYMGEGYKRNRNRVSRRELRSDRRSRSRIAWISGPSPRTGFSTTVQYHGDQDPARLRAFWAFRLGIEPDRIRLQRKSNSNRLSGRTWRSRWGVLTVRADDTQLRARLQGWIDADQTELDHGLDSPPSGRSAAW